MSLYKMHNIQSIFIVVFLLVFDSCKQKTNTSYIIENDPDPNLSGIWMIGTPVLENNSDYSIAFTRGLGGSQYMDMIYYIYKNKSLVDDEKFKWNIDAKEYKAKEIDKNAGSKYYYGAAGQEYIGKTVKLNFLENSNYLLKGKEVYVLNPLEVEFQLNNEIVRPVGYNEPILDPLNDKMHLKWNIEKNNSKMFLQLIKSPPPDQITTSKCYNIKNINQPFYRREFRYIPIEDTGSLTIDNCLFDGLKDELFNISLVRGNRQDVIRDNKTFTIYNMSVSQVRIKAK